ncbi:MAG: hypothetical protein HKO66_15625 [Saprospiraceae bacterium]|nr:hypothetical protein [Bacteroidia bacterium]NNE15950.1 hypothetical protein [Saprospiraceae bacterium]NNL93671.1 hypothetical protein [Saprospiraceae bacterium]
MVLKGFAHLFSVLFHPLLIIIYVLFTFLLINPYLFPYRHGNEFGTIFLIVFFTSVVIPAIAILLLYGTGLIQSLQLKDKSERIGPLIITSISYLWLFLNIRTHNAIPGLFSSFVLGAIIAIFLAFFINNFSKISLHGVGLGGMFFAILNLILSYGRPMTSLQLSTDLTITFHNILFLSMIVIIIGIVLSSRIYLKAHTIQDVFGGFLVGFVSQIVALKLFL